MILFLLVVSTILWIILIVSFFYNLFTKREKHWGFTIGLLVFAILINSYARHQIIKEQILQDEMYEDYMLDQAYDDLYEQNWYEKRDCSSVRKILANTYSCDSKEVFISGMVKDIKHKISKKGNEYTTFVLTDVYYDYDPDYGITVYVGEHKVLAEDSMIWVRGKYHQTKEVSGYTFYNQIDAISFTNYG